MDQVKKALQVLKTHYFWVVCGLATLLVLGAWYSATSNLNATTKERMAAIDKAFSDAQGVSAKSPHPNDLSHAEMDKMANELAAEVALAWKAQYERQKDVLVWPSQFTQGFRDTVRKLQPIEAKVEYPTPPEKDLNPDYVNQYRNYINDELPKLAAIIKSKWTVKAGALGGGSGGMFGSGMSDTFYDGGESTDASAYMGSSMGGIMGRAAEEDGVVVKWENRNQTEIASQFSWPDRSPSTLEILYAQENLWLLQSIMRVIADVNGPVQSNFNATIKEIEFIRLGRTAIGKAGTVMRPQAARAGGMGGMMGAMGSEDYTSDYDTMMMNAGGGEGGGSSGMMASGQPGGAAGAPTVAGPDPADMRYVDNDYQPLPASRVRSALSPTSTEDPFLAVAKRMPVRIRFAKMDHRKLPVLLAACGNAKLPIEIRQVRINRKAMAGGGMGGFGGGGFGGGGFGSGYGDTGGGEMMDMDYDGGGEFGGGMGMMGGMMGRRGGKEFPHDLPVEIYGIIYLYNPVDPEKLGIDVDAVGQEATPPAAASAPAAAGSPVAATPASNPAVPPAAAGAGGAVPAAAVPAAAR